MGKGKPLTFLAKAMQASDKLAPYYSPKFPWEHFVAGSLWGYRQAQRDQRKAAKPSMPEPRKLELTAGPYKGVRLGLPIAKRKAAKKGRG